MDWLYKRINDEQYKAKIAEIKDAHAFVEQVNTVGFLSDQQLEKILQLCNISYKNAEGDAVPLLEAGDIVALSVRKGTITDAEREIMQQHVAITGRLLDKIPFWKYYGNVPQWARCHHEFLDGTGYPLGLSGEEIPIEACIITIMDIFDALIAKDRPYKKAIPIDRALGILSEMADEGKLHKELVQLFIQSNVWEGVV